MQPDHDGWGPIGKLGELTIYDATDSGDVIDRLREADIAVVNKVKLNRQHFEQLPKLKMVAQSATGYDNLNLAAASDAGVVCCNVPEYSTPSVAQHVFAMLMSFIHQPQLHDQAIRDGEWQRRKQFSFWLQPMTELAGRSLGIVGFGRIGQATARVGQSLGMSIRIFSRTRKEVAGFENAMWHDDVESLFAESDVVSLHCPQTPENKHFVNQSLIAKMKPDAILVNAARGALIDEPALADALNRHAIGGACLDVLSSEPPAETNPLLSADRCLLTPHVAWTTVQSRARLLQVVADNIAAFQKGDPQNVLS